MKLEGAQRGGDAVAAQDWMAVLGAVFEKTHRERAPKNGMIFLAIDTDGNDHGCMVDLNN